MTKRRRRGRTGAGASPRGRLQVVEMDLADIHPHPRNARLHDARQVELLEQLVRRFNYMAPVLVHTDGRLIAGHLRFKVAKGLGWRSIAAIVIGPLAEGEVETLMLADNRLAELARWDEAMLAESLKAIVLDDTLDFSAELTGFEAPKIDALVFGDDFARADDNDDALPPQSQGETISRPGDLWTADGIALACGDSLTAEPWSQVMASRRADVIVTDAPYNLRIQGNVSKRHRDFMMGAGEFSATEFIGFLTSSFERMREHASPSALVYAFMDGAHLFELFTAARAAGLEQKAFCTWAKSNAGMGSFYRSQTEHIAIFKAGAGAPVNNIALGRHGRNRTTLWSYPGMNSFGRGRAQALDVHPTVKPVGMLADAILDSTRRGDLVVDPFVGSGSTLIAAHRVGRLAAGIELDPAYVDVALARIAAVTGLDPVRRSDNAPWSALAAARAAGDAP